MTAWHGLLADLAILAIFVSVWTQASDLVRRLPGWLSVAARALLFAAGTVAIMSLPFAIRPGVFVDLRVTMMVLAGFFGGPFVGAAVWLVAIAYRLWVGGVGAPAATIGLTAGMAAGLAAHLARRGGIATTRDIAALAAAGALVSVVGFLLLPSALRLDVVLEIGAPLATLTFVAVAVAGLAMARDERRLETERQNRLYAAIIDALPDPLNAKDLDGRFIAAIRQPPR